MFGQFYVLFPGGFYYGDGDIEHFTQPLDSFYSWIFYSLTTLDEEDLDVIARDLRGPQQENLLAAEDSLRLALAIYVRNLSWLRWGVNQETTERLAGYDYLATPCTSELTDGFDMRFKSARTFRIWGELFTNNWGQDTRIKGYPFRGFPAYMTYDAKESTAAYDWYVGSLDAILDRCLFYGLFILVLIPQTVVPGALYHYGESTSAVYWYVGSAYYSPFYVGASKLCQTVITHWAHNQSAKAFALTELKYLKFLSVGVNWNQLAFTFRGGQWPFDQLWTDLTWFFCYKLWQKQSFLMWELFWLVLYLQQEVAVEPGSDEEWELKWLILWFLESLEANQAWLPPGLFPLSSWAQFFSSYFTTLCNWYALFYDQFDLTSTPQTAPERLRLKKTTSLGIFFQHFWLDNLHLQEASNWIGASRGAYASHWWWSSEAHMVLEPARSDASIWEWLYDYTLLSNLFADNLRAFYQSIQVANPVLWVSQWQSKWDILWKGCYGLHSWLGLGKSDFYVTMFIRSFYPLLTTKRYNTLGWPSPMSGWVLFKRFLANFSGVLNGVMWLNHKILFSGWLDTYLPYFWKYDNWFILKNDPLNDEFNYEPHQLSYFNTVLLKSQLTWSNALDSAWAARTDTQFANWGPWTAEFDDAPGNLDTYKPAIWFKEQIPFVNGVKLWSLAGSFMDDFGIDGDGFWKRNAFISFNAGQFGTLSNLGRGSKLGPYNRGFFQSTFQPAKLDGEPTATGRLPTRLAGWLGALRREWTVRGNKRMIGSRADRRSLDVLKGTAVAATGGRPAAWFGEGFQSWSPYDTFVDPKEIYSKDFMLWWYWLKTFLWHEAVYWHGEGGLAAVGWNYTWASWGPKVWFQDAYSRSSLLGSFGDFWWFSYIYGGTGAEFAASRRSWWYWYADYVNLTKLSWLHGGPQSLELYQFANAYTVWSRYAVAASDSSQLGQFKQVFYQSYTQLSWQNAQIPFHYWVDSLYREFEISYLKYLFYQKFFLFQFCDPWLTRSPLAVLSRVRRRMQTLAPLNVALSGEHVWASELLAPQFISATGAAFAAWWCYAKSWNWFCDWGAEESGDLQSVWQVKLVPLLERYRAWLGTTLFCKLTSLKVFFFFTQFDTDFLWLYLGLWRYVNFADNFVSFKLLLQLFLSFESVKLNRILWFWYWWLSFFQWSSVLQPDANFWNAELGFFNFCSFMQFKGNKFWFKKITEYRELFLWVNMSVLPFYNTLKQKYFFLQNFIYNPNWSAILPMCWANGSSRRTRDELGITRVQWSRMAQAGSAAWYPLSTFFTKEHHTLSPFNGDAWPELWQWDLVHRFEGIFGSVGPVRDDYKPLQHKHNLMSLGRAGMGVRLRGPRGLLVRAALRHQQATWSADATYLQWSELTDDNRLYAFVWHVWQSVGRRLYFKYLGPHWSSYWRVVLAKYKYAFDNFWTAFVEREQLRNTLIHWSKWNTSYVSWDIRPPKGLNETFRLLNHTATRQPLPYITRTMALPFHKALMSGKKFRQIRKILNSNWAKWRLWHMLWNPGGVWPPRSLRKSESRTQHGYVWRKVSSTWSMWVMRPEVRTGAGDPLAWKWYTHSPRWLRFPLRRYFKVQYWEKPVGFQGQPPGIRWPWARYTMVPIKWTLGGWTGAAYDMRPLEYQVNLKRSRFGRGLSRVERIGLWGRNPLFWERLPQRGRLLLRTRSPAWSAPRGVPTFYYGIRSQVPRGRGLLWWLSGSLPSHSGWSRLGRGLYRVERIGLGGRNRPFWERFPPRGRSLWMTRPSGWSVPRGVQTFHYVMRTPVPSGRGLLWWLRGSLLSDSGWSPDVGWALGLPFLWRLLAESRFTKDPTWSMGVIRPRDGWSSSTVKGRSIRTRVYGITPRRSRDGWFPSLMNQSSRGRASDWTGRRARKAVERRVHLALLPRKGRWSFRPDGVLSPQGERSYSDWVQSTAESMQFTSVMPWWRTALDLPEPGGTKTRHKSLLTVIVGSHQSNKVHLIYDWMFAKMPPWVNRGEDAPRQRHLWRSWIVSTPFAQASWGVTERWYWVWSAQWFFRWQHKLHEAWSWQASGARFNRFKTRLVYPMDKFLWVSFDSKDVLWWAYKKKVNIPFNGLSFYKAPNTKTLGLHPAANQVNLDAFQLVLLGLYRPKTWSSIHQFHKYFGMYTTWGSSYQLWQQTYKNYGGTLFHYFYNRHFYHLQFEVFLKWLTLFGNYNQLNWRVTTTFFNQAFNYIWLVNFYKSNRIKVFGPVGLKGSNLSSNFWSRYSFYRSLYNNVLYNFYFHFDFWMNFTLLYQIEWSSEWSKWAFFLLTNNVLSAMAASKAIELRANYEPLNNLGYIFDILKQSNYYYDFDEFDHYEMNSGNQSPPSYPYTNWVVMPDVTNSFSNFWYLLNPRKVLATWEYVLQSSSRLAYLLAPFGRSSIPNIYRTVWASWLPVARRYNNESRQIFGKSFNLPLPTLSWWAWLINAQYLSLPRGPRGLEKLKIRAPGSQQWFLNKSLRGIVLEWVGDVFIKPRPRKKLARRGLIKAWSGASVTAGYDRPQLQSHSVLSNFLYLSRSELDKSNVVWKLGSSLNRGYQLWSYPGKSGSPRWKYKRRKARAARHSVSYAMWGPFSADPWWLRQSGLYTGLEPALYVPWFLSFAKAIPFYGGIYSYHKAVTYNTRLPFNGLLCWNIATHTPSLMSLPYTFINTTLWPLGYRWLRPTDYDLTPTDGRLTLMNIHKRLPYQLDEGSGYYYWSDQRALDPLIRRVISVGVSPFAATYLWGYGIFPAYYNKVVKGKFFQMSRHGYSRRSPSRIRGAQLIYEAEDLDWDGLDWRATKRANNNVYGGSLWWSGFPTNKNKRLFGTPQAYYTRDMVPDLLKSSAFVGSTGRVNVTELVHLARRSPRHRMSWIYAGDTGWDQFDLSKWLVWQVMFTKWWKPKAQAPLAKGGPLAYELRGASRVGQLLPSDVWVGAPQVWWDLIVWTLHIMYPNAWDVGQLLSQQLLVNTVSLNMRLVGGLPQWMWTWSNTQKDPLGYRATGTMLSTKWAQVWEQWDQVQVQRSKMRGLWPPLRSGVPSLGVMGVSLDWLLSPEWRVVRADAGEVGYARVSMWSQALLPRMELFTFVSWLTPDGPAAVALAHLREVYWLNIVAMVQWQLPWISLETDLRGETTLAWTFDLHKWLDLFWRQLLKNFNYRNHFLGKRGRLKILYWNHSTNMVLRTLFLAKKFVTCGQFLPTWLHYFRLSAIGGVRSRTIEWKTGDILNFLDQSVWFIEATNQSYLLRGQWVGFFRTRYYSRGLLEHGDPLGKFNITFNLVVKRGVLVKALLNKFSQFNFFYNFFNFWTTAGQPNRELWDVVGTDAITWSPRQLSFLNFGYWNFFDSALFGMNRTNWNLKFWPTINYFLFRWLYLNSERQFTRYIFKWWHLRNGGRFDIPMLGEVFTFLWWDSRPSLINRFLMFKVSPLVRYKSRQAGFPNETDATSVLSWVLGIGVFRPFFPLDKFYNVNQWGRSSLWDVFYYNFASLNLKNLITNMWRQFHFFSFTQIVTPLSPTDWLRFIRYYLQNVTALVTLNVNIFNRFHVPTMSYNMFYLIHKPWNAYYHMVGHYGAWGLIQMPVTKWAGNRKHLALSEKEKVAFVVQPGQLRTPRAGFLGVLPLLYTKMLDNAYWSRHGLVRLAVSSRSQMWWVARIQDPAGVPRVLPFLPAAEWLPLGLKWGPSSIQGMPVQRSVQSRIRRVLCRVSRTYVIGLCSTRVWNLDLQGGRAFRATSGFWSLFESVGHWSYKAVFWEAINQFKQGGVSVRQFRRHFWGSTAVDPDLLGRGVSEWVWFLRAWCGVGLVMVPKWLVGYPQLGRSVLLRVDWPLMLLLAGYLLWFVAEDWGPALVNKTPKQLKEFWSVYAQSWHRLVYPGLRVTYAQAAYKRAHRGMWTLYARRRYGHQPFNLSYWVDLVQGLRTYALFFRSRLFQVFLTDADIKWVWGVTPSRYNHPLWNKWPYCPVPWGLLAGGVSKRVAGIWMMTAIAWPLRILSHLAYVPFNKWMGWDHYWFLWTVVLYSKARVSGRLVTIMERIPDDSSCLYGVNHRGDVSAVLGLRQVQAAWPQVQGDTGLVWGSSLVIPWTFRSKLWKSSLRLGLRRISLITWLNWGDGSRVLRSPQRVHAYQWRITNRSVIWLRQWFIDQSAVAFPMIRWWPSTLSNLPWVSSVESLTSAWDLKTLDNILQVWWHESRSPLIGRESRLLFIKEPETSVVLPVDSNIWAWIYDDLGVFRIPYPRTGWRVAETTLSLELRYLTEGGDLVYYHQPPAYHRVQFLEVSSSTLWPVTVVRKGALFQWERSQSGTLFHGHLGSHLATQLTGQLGLKRGKLLRDWFATYKSFGLWPWFSPISPKVKEVWVSKAWAQFWFWRVTVWPLSYESNLELQRRAGVYNMFDTFCWGTNWRRNPALDLFKSHYLYQNHFFRAYHSGVLFYCWRIVLYCQKARVGRHPLLIQRPWSPHQFPISMASVVLNYAEICQSLMVPQMWEQSYKQIRRLVKVVWFIEGFREDWTLLNEAALRVSLWVETSDGYRRDVWQVCEALGYKWQTGVPLLRGLWPGWLGRWGNWWINKSWSVWARVSWLCWDRAWRFRLADGSGGFVWSPSSWTDFAYWSQSDLVWCRQDLGVVKPPRRESFAFIDLLHLQKKPQAIEDLWRHLSYMAQAGRIVHDPWRTWLKWYVYNLWAYLSMLSDARPSLRWCVNWDEWDFYNWFMYGELWDAWRLCHRTLPYVAKSLLLTGSGWGARFEYYFFIYRQSLSDLQCYWTSYMWQWYWCEWFTTYVRQCQQDLVWSGGLLGVWPTSYQRQRWALLTYELWCYYRSGVLLTGVAWLQSQYARWRIWAKLWLYLATMWPITNVTALIWGERLWVRSSWRGSSRLLSRVTSQGGAMPGYGGARVLPRFFHWAWAAAGGAYVDLLHWQGFVPGGDTGLMGRMWVGLAPLTTWRVEPFMGLMASVWRGASLQLLSLWSIDSSQFTQWWNTGYPSQSWVLSGSSHFAFQGAARPLANIKSFYWFNFASSLQRWSSLGLPAVWRRPSYTKFFYWVFLRLQVDQAGPIAPPSGAWSTTQQQFHAYFWAYATRWSALVTVYTSLKSVTGSWTNQMYLNFTPVSVSSMYKWRNLNFLIKFLFGLNTLHLDIPTTSQAFLTTKRADTLTKTAFVVRERIFNSWFLGQTAYVRFTPRPITWAVLERGAALWAIYQLDPGSRTPLWVLPSSNVLGRQWRNRAFYYVDKLIYYVPNISLWLGLDNNKLDYYNPQTSVVLKHATHDWYFWVFTRQGSVGGNGSEAESIVLTWWMVGGVVWPRGGAPGLLDWSPLDPGNLMKRLKYRRVLVYYYRLTALEDYLVFRSPTLAGFGQALWWVQHQLLWLLKFWQLRLRFVKLFKFLIWWQLFVYEWHLHVQDFKIPERVAGYSFFLQWSLVTLLPKWTLDWSGAERRCIWGEGRVRSSTRFYGWHTPNAELWRWWLVTLPCNGLFFANTSLNPTRLVSESLSWTRNLYNWSNGMVNIHLRKWDSYKLFWSYFRIYAFEVALYHFQFYNQVWWQSYVELVLKQPAKLVALTPMSAFLVRFLSWEEVLYTFYFRFKWNPVKFNVQDWKYFLFWYYLYFRFAREFNWFHFAPRVMLGSWVKWRVHRRAFRLSSVKGRVCF